MTEVDRLEFHSKALAGLNPPIHNDQPQAGYYRFRTAPEQPWEPIAIWWDKDGKITTNYLGENEQAIDPREIWPWVARHPVAFEDFQFRQQNGHWPGEPAPIGHNQPPEDAEESAQADDDDAAYNAARAELRKLQMLAGTLLRQGDKANVDKATEVKDQMLALRLRVKKEHEAEKEPWLIGSHTVDERWLPMHKTTKELADKLLDGIITPVLQARRAEERRRAQEEAAQLAAFQKSAQAEAQGAAPAPPAAVSKPEPPPLPRAEAGGLTTGRTTKLKESRLAVVTDQDAFYQFLRNDADVVELLKKKAQKIINAQGSAPGITFNVVEKAR